MDLEHTRKVIDVHTKYAEFVQIKPYDFGISEKEFNAVKQEYIDKGWEIKWHSVPWDGTFIHGTKLTDRIKRARELIHGKPKKK
mgnify:CR=1 FL=1